MRVLDEMAESLYIARGRPWPRSPVRSVALADQVIAPIDAPLWRSIGRRLRCELPPLRHGNLPAGFRTVWDLADWVAWQRPGLEPPRERTAEAWADAQVFVVVRETLVEALNVEPREVVRSARLMHDLGAE